MTFTEALRIAKEKNIPHQYQEEVWKSNCLSPKALYVFQNEFIFYVKELSK